MKKLFQLILIILFVNSSFAQTACSDETIMQVKGNWKKRNDANMKADKNQAQIINRIDNISKLFQEAYPAVKGMEAGWYRTMEHNPVINNGPTPYQFNSLFLAWYCNQNLHKLMLGTETGTWALVYINDFGWFMGDQYDKAAIEIESQTAYMLPKLVGQWKGLALYQPSASSTYTEHRAVLIARNNQLPYKPVSRLQYLQATKEKLENAKQEQIVIIDKRSVRTDIQEEETKQKGLENIAKYNRADQVERRNGDYLKNYKTDKQRKEEDLQRTTKNYDDQLNAIESIRKKYDKDELQQPAIIDEQHSFKDFTTQEKGGRMIVVVNAAYFNIQLPRYAPQFMILYWRIQEDAPSQNFKKQLEENFPIEKLKALVDK